MAEPTTVKTLRDGEVKFKDGAGTPLEYVVAYEEGNFAYADPKAAQVVVRDRGAIAGLRKGDDPVISGSFSIHFRKMADTSDATMLDVINKTNAWASATSTGGTGFEQFLVDLVFTVDSTAVGDTADDVATFSKCHLSYEFAEGETDKVTVNFECYGGLTRTGN